MAKCRLGVALLLPDPVRAEIDGLRRALGDRALRRIPPHITLVPPVNVREEQLDEAFAILRRAAVTTPHLRLTIGPPATFLPDNPVVYLQVGGDVASLRTLRDAVFVESLDRPLTWAWVPHVTIADEAAPERISAALAALQDYVVEVTFEGVHLLRENPGRLWQPVANALFTR